MEIKLNGKALLGIALLSAGLAFGNYVSLIDAKSSGGIIVNEVNNNTPIGTVAMWANATPPEGWIEMKGQSTSGYPELAAVVGSNVPDMRGQFARGWDNGKGTDSGRSIKTVQNFSTSSIGLSFVGNALPAHNHSSTSYGITGYTHAHDGDVDGSRVVTGYDKSTVPNPATTSVSAGTPTGVINSSASETRPTNVALMYIIKAENI